MPEHRVFRGAPFLSVWPWLIAGAVVSATWLIWLEDREPQVDSGVSLGEDPIAAVLDNLRMVEAIARTGPEGVPGLVEALANPNFRLRRNALLALRQMGPDAAEAVSSIRDRLADEDAWIRLFAIDAYWYVRRDPDDVAAVLAPMLGDPEANVREAAGKVLESIGPRAIGTVVELLRSGASAARVSALRVLRRIGWDASQPEVEDAVRDHVRDPDVRVEALWTLAAWGHATPPEIGELLRIREAADSGRSDPRTERGPCETALYAIIRQRPSAENLNDVLDILDENQRVENEWNRAIAARSLSIAQMMSVARAGDQWNLALAALRSMQSAGRSATPRLLQVVDSIHDHRRIDIWWTLLEIGFDARDIAGITVPFLLDKDTDVCFHAGRLCASASADEARRQLSRLIPLLAPEKLADGLSALDAVWGLAPQAQEAIPTLCRLLESPQPHVARIAAKALRDMGSQAAPALPALLAQLSRGLEAHDYSACSAFCEAIGKMGPVARGAIPALLVELNDEPLSRPPVHQLNRIGQIHIGVVLSALVRIRDSDPEVLVAIRRHLANEDDQVQVFAIRALARLTPDSPEILTCHLNWLRENRPSQNRAGMILAIGRLTGDRRDAVTLLSALLADDNPDIRKAAAWSLGTIGAQASAALPALKEVLKDWKDSLYSFHHLHSPRRPDDPRGRLETGRWFDLEDLLSSGMEDPPFREKSVHQVVRESIAEIEAVDNDVAPPALRN